MCKEKLVSRLSVIQKELKVPKERENSFGGFSFRNAEDILKNVKPMLNGLSLVISDEVEMHGDRIYIKATASLSDGEETITTTGLAREAVSKTKMDDAQLTGSTSSYARKYALNGMFLIDDSVDIDSEQMPRESSRIEQNINEQQLEILKLKTKEFAEMQGDTVTNVAKMISSNLNVPFKFNEMNNNDFGKVMNFLNKNLNNNANKQPVNKNKQARAWE